MKRLFAICILCLFAVGCANIAPLISPAAAQSLPRGIEGVITKLANAAVPDLQAASADAKAHNDPVADQCWSGLVPIVQQIQSLLTPKSTTAATPCPEPGAFCRLQQVRDAKGTVDALVSLRNSGQIAQIRQAVNLACGALWVDINASVVDPLGLVSGAAVAPAP